MSQMRTIILIKSNQMDWYNTLTRSQKANIREVFELACGMKLTDALKLFTFIECMDILHNKLRSEQII